MMTQPETSYTLVVRSGDNAGYVYPLWGEEVSIGRLPENHLAFPDDLRASRRHARLRRTAEGWVLEDVGSANGTYLGQRRLYDPTLLRPGDQIRVGRTWLELQAELPEEEVSSPQVELVSDPLADEQVWAGQDNVVYSVPAEAASPELSGMLEEMHQHLAVLWQASRALSETLDLDRLLETVVDLIMEVVPAERAFLLLRQEGEFHPRVVRHREPTPRSDEPLTISRSIVEFAARDRRTILSSDATTDERFADLASVRDFQIRSTICSPIVRGSEVLAVLFLDTTSVTHLFTENDVNLVNALASLAATAIENARLYTQLREAYDELAAAQDSLIRSEKLSTIGTLAASLAHDMSNIISPLAPLIAMLSAGEDVPEEAREILRREVRRLGVLVQRLYSFAQVEGTELRPVQINDVLREGIALLTSGAMHRRVTLNVSLADDLPQVTADPDQVYRAVLNLVMNALEAMEEQPEATLDLRTYLDQDEVVIEVKDNGPGVPEAIQDRLFEPFFTTKAGGTGLGLHSTRRIIEEEHQGVVELDSPPGEGTTVRLRLHALVE